MRDSRHGLRVLGGREGDGASAGGGDLPQTHLFREARLELLREARLALQVWESNGSDEDRGRLLQTLELLAVLVRFGPDG